MNILPNSNKILNYDNNLYFNNPLLRLLTQVDYDNIQNDYNDIINTYIPQQIDNSMIYATSSADYPTFNVSRNIKGIICSVAIQRSSGSGGFAPFVFIPKLNTSASVVGCTTSTSRYTSLRGAEAIQIRYTTSNTSLRITYLSAVDDDFGNLEFNTTSCVIFT